MLGQRRRETLALVGDGEADLADDLLEALGLQADRDVVQRLEDRNADVERAGDVLEEREAFFAVDAAVRDFADLLRFAAYFGAHEERAGLAETVGEHGLGGGVHPPSWTVPPSVSALYQNSGIVCIAIAVRR